jgi:tetratricopeptide (TPR) repeat protein
VRKELIRPDRPRLIGEDGFRFRHLLIRDAAYDALPKAVRADLHRRFASWLEHRGADLVEADELVGYHLEQACTFDTELGQTDDQVAAEARRRLTAAALRAASRNDFGGATHLLERAAALLRPEDVDIALELQLAESLHEIGRSADARARAEAVAARAAARGDRVGELCGRLQAAVMDIYLEPDGATDRLDALVSEALPTLQLAADDVALHTVYAAGAWAAVVRGRTDTALDGYERAALHARAAGLPNEYVGWRGLCRLYGSTPIPDVMAWLEEHDNGQDLWLRAARGMCLAMLGRFDEARAILDETRTALAERGATQRLGVITGIESAAAEITAGNLDRAAELGAEGCRILEELGDEAFLSYATARLANTLVGLGRIDEADVLARRAAELGARDDAFNQMMLLRAEGKVLARRGALEASERLLREAVEIGGTTDDPIEQADALADFGGVLLESGRRDDAAAAFAQALERYERKGNLVMAGRTRARLDELVGPRADA